MIFGVEEGGRVRIYADLEEAQQNWRQYPFDLLSEVIRLYREDGAWLKPEGLYEPRRWFPWSNRLSGVTFLPVDPESEAQDGLAYLLAHEASDLLPNKYVASLDELRRKFPYKRS